MTAGFNNDFLIKTQDDWAIDSNDKYGSAFEPGEVLTSLPCRSPNESHHLASAWKILRNPEANFIHRMPHAQQVLPASLFLFPSPLTSQTQVQLRKLVIDMVLATDMAEHIAIVSRLKTDLQKVQHQHFASVCLVVTCFWHAEAREPRRCH